MSDPGLPGTGDLKGLRYLYANGVRLAERLGINFVGFWCADDSANDRITVHASGACARPAVATYLVPVGVSVVLADPAVTSLVRLPQATLSEGRDIVVKDYPGSAASHNVTINGVDSATIDGAASDTIATNHAARKYHCNGASWEILGSYAAA